ncbi:Crp/Fnr family transcriptional regulator [Roseobacteraceae bacterium S113]
MHDLKTLQNNQGDLGVSKEAPDRLISLLEPLAHPVRVAKGRDLFAKGDEADALFVVRKGVMEIGTISEDGRRLAHIVIRPGAVFGEVALFDGGTRSASVSARTDAQLWKINGVALLAAIQTSPELAIELLKLTVGRLRWMSAQVEDQAFESVEVRLARRLTFLLQTMGNEGVLKISQSELSEHVGSTRETVSKILSEWKDAGVLEIGRGKLKLHDPRALFDIAAFGYL